MNLLKSFIGKPVRIAKYRLLKPFGSYDYKKFIVLTRSRTGSNLLISYLNSHSEIHAQGEAFSRLHGKRIEDVFCRLFSRQPYYIRATGCKVFYYHPLDGDSAELLSRLEEMKDLYVIHLRRRNILRTLLSRKIAGIQDVWVSGKENGEGRPAGKAVHFTVEELRDGFEETRSWEEAGETRFIRHRSLDVCYEDLVLDPGREFRRVTDLLELKSISPRSGLKKQNREAASELIVNYEEVRQAFKGTCWASFFED